MTTDGIDGNCPMQNCTNRRSPSLRSRLGGAHSWLQDLLIFVVFRRAACVLRCFLKQSLIPLAQEMERLFIQTLVLPATILVWPVLLNLQMLLHGVRGQTKVWRPLPLLSKMVLMECLQWVCVWIVPMMNYLLLSNICLIVSSKLSLRQIQNLPIFQIQEFLYPHMATQRLHF